MAETIAAIATPPGMGALGLLRVSGPGALAAALALLELPALEPRRATVAWARGGDGPIDQVVATFFPGAQSATGEDLVELCAHGSPFILRRLLSECLRLGASAAAPGEFTQRAFLNGRMDLAQAEAVCRLIAARTDAAHRSALVQLSGGLSRRLSELRAPILELLVWAEAVLDHPEEDIPALEAPETARRLEAALRPLQALASTYGQGRLLSEGARVVLVGRPNAGKSSLLNALLGCERAIVRPEPGTTRDTLEERASVSGRAAVLIDTAGLREEACDPAERAGIERARRALESADVALLVVDASRPSSRDDDAVHARLLEEAARRGRPVVKVLNKSDVAASRREPGSVAVSALAGTGMEALLSELGRALDGAGGGGEDSVLITEARHLAALDRAASELSEARGLVLAAPRAFEDRLAHRLREALGRLDEIEGKGADSEVLHAVFSRFCVGK